jgi:diguanylate cyclase (GGDEF)-like protein
LTVQAETRSITSHEPALERHRPTERVEAASIEESQRANTATIMIVDDEPTTIEVLQILLEDAGYERFITTCDSTQAVRLASESNPDLLLLDLVMPEVDGLQILREIRADGELCHTPVVVLTSATDAATKLNALELGATDFLGKPVDPSELALRLRNTLAAKAYQDRLANYDRLTDLPNKGLFMKRLGSALERASRDGRSCAVLHIGINRIGKINDTLGHEMGDRLLEQVAHRLDKLTRRDNSTQALAEDTGVSHVARFEGGEFVLCIPTLPTLGYASKVAKRLLDAFEAPFLINAEKLLVNLSIGISIFPSDGRNNETLLKHARIATSHAKRVGKSGVEFYSKELNARSVEQLRIEHDLHGALERDELLLHYQPKFNLRSGEMEGAEALLRWQHPTMGLISPAQFIPIAEETGLIVPFGYWVLKTAYRQSLAWEAEGIPKVRVAVNVSSVQFRESNLLARLRNSALTGDLDTDRLTLEITESMVIDHLEETVNTLSQLREMGFKVSLDDFGTGYSSLSRLKRLPIDELKIDRSFIVDVPDSKDDAAILNAVIVMAHGLGLTVVTEGIETPEQRDFLRELDCDLVQGFLLGKPMTAEDFTARFKTPPVSD